MRKTEMRSIKLWIFLFLFVLSSHCTDGSCIEASLWNTFFVVDCRTLKIKRGYYINLMFDFRSHVINSEFVRLWTWLSVALSWSVGQCWDHSIWFIIFVPIPFCSYPWPSTTRLLAFEVKSKETGDVRRLNNFVLFSKIFIHAWCFVIWKKKEEEEKRNERMKRRK